MEQFLIDTNAVCYYITGVLSEGGLKFMDAVIDKLPNVSVITKIELLCWNTTEDRKQAVQLFLHYCNVYNLTEDLARHCVDIKKGKRIKLPDAIIVATASAHGLVLITANESDFSQIPGLKISNPTAL